MAMSMQAAVPKKQISIVLEAVESGCETSNEVSALTGIPIKQCCHWLCELRKSGLIILTHKRHKGNLSFQRYARSAFREAE